MLNLSGDLVIFSFPFSNILCSWNIFSCHGSGADDTAPYKDAGGSYSSCVGAVSPSLEGKKYQSFPSPKTAVYFSLISCTHGMHSGEFVC